MTCKVDLTVIEILFIVPLNINNFNHVILNVNTNKSSNYYLLPI